jgi:hypothetical protein
MLIEIERPRGITHSTELEDRRMDLTTGTIDHGLISLHFKDRRLTQLVIVAVGLSDQCCKHIRMPTQPFERPAHLRR